MDIPNITLDDLELIKEGVIEIDSVDVPMLRGLSAYAVAVKNGFVGSEEQWLNSLKVEFEASAREFLEDAESSENIRKQNELLRIDTENIRQSQESSRQINEGIRTSNEDVREANEVIRNSSESQRQSNEGIREKNENTRIENENNRIQEFADMLSRVLLPENVLEGSNIVITREGDTITISTSGLGDMQKTTYDINDNGIVDNAEKVNNHTIESDVPANAVFTDTVYDDTILSGKVTTLETETDNLLNNKADKSTTYTKTQTDNLLDDKADSSNVYTKTETDDLLDDKANQSDLDTTNTNVSNKVDKVTGKGLSTNDFTDTYKTKLDGIATGANKTTIAKNLTTTTAGSALDATQGKTLYGLIFKESSLFSGSAYSATCSANLSNYSKVLIELYDEWDSAHYTTIVVNNPRSTQVVSAFDSSNSSNFKIATIKIANNVVSVVKASQINENGTWNKGDAVIFKITKVIGLWK